MKSRNILLLWTVVLVFLYIKFKRSDQRDKISERSKLSALNEYFEIQQRYKDTKFKMESNCEGLLDLEISSNNNEAHVHCGDRSKWESMVSGSYLLLESDSVDVGSLIRRVIHENAWNDQLHAVGFVGRNAILEKSLVPKTKYTDIDIKQDEFYKIAKTTKTDKVRIHKYHHM